jgi:hypothetical protein
MDWVHYMTGQPVHPHKEKFYIPRLTASREMHFLIKTVLTKLLYTINIYPVESKWHERGKIVVSYDEDPNPTVFIVNQMYNVYIDMVEVFQGKFRGEPELIFQYSRSFYQEDHPFFRDKVRYLNSKMMKWNEIKNQLQLLAIRFL